MKAFGGILGKGMSSLQLEKLFMKIDANSDETVDWDEFMNFMLLENQSLDIMTVDTANYELQIKPDPPLATDTKIHREMINKILSIQEERVSDKKKMQKYITAGRDGKVKIWNAASLELAQTINVVSKAWVTTICYMERSGVIAVGAGDRSLTFYELATGQPTSKVTLKDGMPLAMGYIYLASQKKEVLAVGDDLGILHVYTMGEKWHMCDYQTLKDKCLSCHSAELEAKREKLMSSLDSAKGNDRSSKKNPKVLIIQYLDRVEVKGLRLHQGWITRVIIIEDLDSIVTSSLDGFVHFHGIEDHKYKRTFKLHQKGINALVWSKSNRFFASCGEERNM